MLKRTRKGGALDTQRAGEAVGHAGIDPRVWCSEAIVTGVNVDDEGFYVDVLLVPDNLEETARVGTMYAGPSFGLYFPIEVDDSVLVIAPFGSPDHGLVAIPRFWSPAEPPPGDAVSHPNDVILHVKSGKTVRIVTGGSGNIVLDPRGSGSVRLGGDATAVHPACRGDSLQASLNALISAYNEHKHNGVASGGSQSGTTTSTASSSPASDLSPNVRVS
jgi:hypothetical protein